MATYAKAKSNGDFESNHERVRVETGIAAEIVNETDHEIQFRVQQSPHLLRASASEFKQFFEVPRDERSQQALRRRYEGE